MLLNLNFQKQSNLTPSPLLIFRRGRDCRRRRKVAFTLAEVLITLGIIGVVAAITIPTLINKINMLHYKAMLREDYLLFSQAFNKISYDNETFIYAFSKCKKPDHNCLKNLFKTELKYIKECNSKNDLKNCFVEQNEVKNYNGQKAGYEYFNSNTGAGLILANGSSILFYSESIDCKVIRGTDNECAFFVLDVNGLKSPNTWGKDLYLFKINDKNIKPASVDNCDACKYKDDCIKGGKGFSCASKYLINTR